MRIFFPLFLILALLPCFTTAAEKPLPRVLIALYDSREESMPWETSIHRFLEMPANHLGYDIQYYDVATEKLPMLDSSVAGLVLWFNSGARVPDVPGYLAWLKKAASQKKKLLILENGGLGDEAHYSADIMHRWNEVLSYVGAQDDGAWNDITYQVTISHMDKNMVEFERKLTPPFPEIAGFHLLPGGKAVSHLRMHIKEPEKDNDYDMIITGSNGGLVAPGYAIYTDAQKEHHQEHVTQEWIMNPFLFLKESLGPALYPVPDATTLDGKRIFYSHIDGDGWNNVTEIEKYRDKNILSSEILYKEVFKPYSDFGFNVALIAADVDPTCAALPGSAEIAREIFALPNVEPASHTYSHPFYWAFFEDYTPEKEKPLLKYYPPKPSERNTVSQMVNNYFNKPNAKGFNQDVVQVEKYDTHKHGKYDKSEKEILEEEHTPRAYACSPFDLKQEIVGAINTVKSLSPPGKTVRLIQWPGDTEPFKPALAMTYEAGLLNINGGDSRFDKEFPSYSFVAPIGIQAKHYRQIYASNSNEETYTDDWHDRFFGFRYLQATVANTESPIRISPFNIYFHMFSGQKEASLIAVKENLDYARKQDIIPITAGDYAAIAEGFYETQISQDGTLSWHITDRGDLGTVRFDDAEEDISVNFNRSNGILGQVFYQGSLYVALDPAVDEVHLVLYKLKKNEPVSEKSMYLVKSRWRIKNLVRGKNTINFETSGYGQGEMIWHVEPNTKYLVNIKYKGSVLKSSANSTDKGLLYITINNPGANQPVQVNIYK